MAKCPECGQDSFNRREVGKRSFFSCDIKLCGHSSAPYPNSMSDEEILASISPIAQEPPPNSVIERIEKAIDRKKLIREIQRILEPYLPDEEFEKKLPEKSLSSKNDGVKKDVKSKPIQSNDERDSKIPDEETKIFLEKISNLDDYNIAKIIPQESSEPEYEEIAKLENIHTKLEKYITGKFKLGMYKHQVELFNKINNEENTVITSPTSSGKTESFLFPILNYILENPQSEGVIAALVYPTKALTQDQVSRIEKYAKEFDIEVERMDGDTENKDRETILKKKPKILLTNFDFIHHRLWRKNDVDIEFNKLFKNLKFLVIDEIHKYEGIHAAQVHHIIRRMRRMYGEFKIIGASATIHNPKKFCETLIGKQVQVISGKGRVGKITLFVLYPTKISQKELRAKLATSLVNEGRRVLCFSNSKMGAEELAIEIQEQGCEIGVHRAGLLQSERDNVIKNFKNKAISAVSATPTLEVGIDIGDIDAVVSEYVPYQTLKQRIGRAGRDGQESYGFLVLDPDDPISRFYYEHPDQYEYDNLEILLDPYNELIEKIHLIFSAMDNPISSSEIEKMKEEENIHDNYKTMKRHATDFIDHTILVPNNDGEYVPDSELLPDEKLRNFSVRDIGMSVDIMEGGKKIGEWDIPMALEKLYEKSIYLHSKKIYRSKGINLKTSPIKSTVQKITDENEKHTRTSPKIEKFPAFDAETHPFLDEKELFGKKVDSQNSIITKLWFLTINKVIREQYVKNKKDRKGWSEGLEPFTYGLRTTGIEINLSNIHGLSQIPEYMQNKTGVFHALEHLLIQSANMLAGGISGNLDGISEPKNDSIIIFDRSTNGGNGASRKLFLVMEEVFKRAREIVEKCDCEDGCPRCTHYNLCNERNSNLNKSGAKSLLKLILGETRYKSPQKEKNV